MGPALPSTQGIVSILRKERRGPGGHCAGWNKPDAERSELSGLICVWNSYKADSIQAESRMVVTWWGGGLGDVGR